MVVILLVIDQIIKLYIKTHFYLGESVRVTDWFFIDFVENNGMAWGMSFINKLTLSLVRTVAIIVLLCYLRSIIKSGTHRLLYIYMVALVTTGAIGNMIDSMFYGLIFTSSEPFYVAKFVPLGSRARRRLTTGNLTKTDAATLRWHLATSSISTRTTTANSTRKTTST